MATEIAEREKLAYSIEECGARLGLGRNSMYRAVQENRIPHIKLRGRILIPRTALEAWLLKAGQGQSK